MMFAAVAGLAVFVPEPIACDMTCVGVSATKEAFFLPTCTCIWKYAGDLRFLAALLIRTMGKAAMTFGGSG
jgi:hypothetical protein